MQLRISLALLIPLAACSGGDSQSPDAPVQMDAGAATVRAVTCPPGGAPMVTTSDTNDTSFMPSSTTISRGGIVKFSMSPSHNVAPNTIRPSDPGLKVGFGATACLEFDASGTFSFICTAHSFAGTVIVQ
jgi:plastocyanin